MKEILMRIDFQNDFVDEKGALSIHAPELIKKHQFFATKTTPQMFDLIIDTYDTHFAETYNLTTESLSYPIHCIFASWGWQQAAPFNETLNVKKMYKSTTNIWNEENHYALLAGNFEDNKVYLCGVLSDVCVKQALDGLLTKGAEVCIIEDLCRGIKEQISDILKNDFYRSYLLKGKLSTVQSDDLLKMKGIKND